MKSERIMEITLQYFDDCPNWKITDQTLKDLIDRHDLGIAIRYQLIDTPEAADEHSFRGSPTVLIDGADPFLVSEAPVGLSCRLYITENGPAGSPSLDQLESAITAAMSSDGR
jgi:hypothetical protein